MFLIFLAEPFRGSRIGVFSAAQAGSPQALAHHDYRIKKPKQHVLLLEVILFFDQLDDLFFSD
jgi:hypothetical protein